jgi:methionine--tRNA ligase beta chain
MDQIKFEDFKKIDLRVAKIVFAEKVQDSEKLIRLELDLGGEKRQIVAGIGNKYQPEELVGKNIVIVANLEPRKLMGIESQGMLLAASNENEGPILLTTMEDIASGSEIR